MALCRLPLTLMLPISDLPAPHDVPVATTLPETALESAGSAAAAEAEATTAAEAEAAAPLATAEVDLPPEASQPEVLKLETLPEPAVPTAAPMSPAACAAQLKQLFPALFSGVAKPLKLRIQADIQARAPGLFTKPLLSVVLRRYTGSHSYLVALTQATQRFDLDGAPAGELSAEHKQVAMDELTLRRANLRAAQRAPQKEAQRNSPRSGQGAAVGVSKNLPQSDRQSDRPTAPLTAPETDVTTQVNNDAKHDAAQIAQRQIQKNAQREAQRLGAEQQALEDQKRRNRATLLHDFENTTLTAANFSALKGITVEAMQGYLATAREEAKARRSAFIGTAGAANEALQQTAHQRPHGSRDAPHPRDSRDSRDSRESSDSQQRRPRPTVGANTDGRGNRPAREPQR